MRRPSGRTAARLGGSHAAHRQIGPCDSPAASSRRSWSSRARFGPVVHLACSSPSSPSRRPRVVRHKIDTTRAPGWSLRPGRPPRYRKVSPVTEVRTDRIAPEPSPVTATREASVAPTPLSWEYTVAGGDPSSAGERRKHHSSW
jgi:hypothetical protein